jgi:hypothetical protein
MQSDDGSTTTSPNWTPGIAFLCVVGGILVLGYFLASEDNKYRAAHPKKVETWGGHFVEGDCPHPPCGRKFVPGRG